MIEMELPDPTDSIEHVKHLILEHVGLTKNCDDYILVFGTTALEDVETLNTYGEWQYSKSVKS